jgi:hypothetical protein
VRAPATQVFHAGKCLSTLDGSRATTSGQRARLEGDDHRRALALPDSDASQLEEADESGAVAAAAFDREGGHAQLQRPVEQAALAGFRRYDLTAVELGAEPVERDRDLRVRVSVDPSTA